MAGVKTIFEFPNGIRYEGTVNRKKLPHGLGCIIYPNGSRYDGLWKDGKKDGKGKQIFSVSEQYDGEWKANKKEGKGIYAFSNGDLYDGFYSNDKRHGNGTYRHTNGGNRSAAPAAACCVLAGRSWPLRVPMRLRGCACVRRVQARHLRDARPARQDPRRQAYSLFCLSALTTPRCVGLSLSHTNFRSRSLARTRARSLTHRRGL